MQVGLMMRNEQNNLSQAVDVTNDVVQSSDEHKTMYQKPQTTLFLDPKNIAGGSQGIVESNNNGALS